MMATDRELLEMAAKSAHLPVEFDGEVNGWFACGRDEHGDVAQHWNPLLDDGDALRLAVSLGQCGHPLLMFTPDKDDKCAVVRDFLYQPHERITESDANLDAASQLRRAIVRIAAEIYKSSLR